MSFSALERQDSSTRVATAAAAVGSLKGFLFSLSFSCHFYKNALEQ